MNAPSGGAPNRFHDHADRVSDLRCVIVVSGELDERFVDAFADLSICATDGETTLTGTLRDQSHLQGVLRQLFDLGLDITTLSATLQPPIISTRRSERNALSGTPVSARRHLVTRITRVS